MELNINKFFISIKRQQVYLFYFLDIINSSE